jgi:hypothetical protein
MNRRILTAGVVSCLVGLAASVPALAQGAVREIASKVAFEFTVGDKVFPAGEYRVTRDPHRMPELRIQSSDGKLQSALVPITRLARQHQGDAPTASLVFDAVGERQFLSEVWLPGQDGYLLRETKEEHRHDVVDAK